MAIIQFGLTNNKLFLHELALEPFTAVKFVFYFDLKALTFK